MKTSTRCRKTKASLAIRKATKKTEKKIKPTKGHDSRLGNAGVRPSGRLFRVSGTSLRLCLGRVDNRDPLVLDLLQVLVLGFGGLGLDLGSLRVWAWQCQ